MSHSDDDRLLQGLLTAALTVKTAESTSLPEPQVNKTGAKPWLFRTTSIQAKNEMESSRPHAALWPVASGLVQALTRLPEQRDALLFGTRNMMGEPAGAYRLCSDRMPASERNLISHLEPKHVPAINPFSAISVGWNECKPREKELVSAPVSLQFSAATKVGSTNREDSESEERGYSTTNTV